MWGRGSTRQPGDGIPGMPRHPVHNPVHIAETGHQIKALTKLRKARIANYSQITVPQIIRSEKRSLFFFEKYQNFYLFKLSGLFFIQHGEYSGQDFALLVHLHRRISKIVRASYDS